MASEAKTVNVGSDEIRQGQPIALTAGHEWAAGLHSHNRFAGDEVVDHRSTGVVGALVGCVEEDAEDVIASHVERQLAREVGEYTGPGIEFVRAIVGMNHGDFAPSGVHTTSTFGSALRHTSSRTVMAKTLVPTLTLAVRGRTLFVATIPVPASPSGGHTSAPGSKPPEGSSSRVPAGVSVPAGRPAQDSGQEVLQRARRTCGAVALHQVIDHAQHPLVVGAGGRVDREHARGIANSEDVLAGQAEVNPTGQGGQAHHSREVAFTVEMGLVVVGHGPPLGDVDAQGATELPEQLEQSWYPARSGMGRAIGRPRPEQCNRASWPTPRERPPCSATPCTSWRSRRRSATHATSPPSMCSWE